MKSFFTLLLVLSLSSVALSQEGYKNAHIFYNKLKSTDAQAVFRFRFWHYAGTIEFYENHTLRLTKTFKGDIEYGIHRTDGLCGDIRILMKEDAIVVIVFNGDPSELDAILQSFYEKGFNDTGIKEADLV